MTDYILPKIPERGTKEFREYASRVMLHDGPIICTSVGQRDAELVSRPGWDFIHCDYYIESECLPKPKARRWYTREEFIRLFATWPGAFLIKGGNCVRSCRMMVSPDSYHFTTPTGKDCGESNFHEYNYSHDGGQSWHPFGVEE